MHSTQRIHRRKTFSLLSRAESAPIAVVSSLSQIVEFDNKVDGFSCSMPCIPKREEAPCVVIPFQLTHSWHRWRYRCWSTFSSSPVSNLSTGQKSKILCKQRRSIGILLTFNSGRNTSQKRKKTFVSCLLSLSHTNDSIGREWNREQCQRENENSTFAMCDRQSFDEILRH
jgi:hypothetical protein